MIDSTWLDRKSVLLNELTTDEIIGRTGINKDGSWMGTDETGEFK